MESPPLIEFRRSWSHGCGGWPKTVPWCIALGIGAALVMSGLLGLAFWAGEEKEKYTASLSPVPVPVPPPSLPPLAPLPNSSLPASPQEKDCEWVEYRLPGWVIPAEYHLDLDVELEEPFTVRGRVAILLSVKQETHCVLIHAENMEITSIKLQETDVEGSSIEDAILRRHMLKFPSALPMPLATLLLEFNYALQAGMLGFYRAKFEDENGESRQLGCTNFEAQHARMAFPCFDEPALKAKFSINLSAPNDVACISNMPEAASVKLGGRTKHVFEKSPAMSTYHTAWVLGEGLKSWEKNVQTAEGEKPFRIWGSPKRLDGLHSALDMSGLIVPFYEKLLNMTYSLPKVDIVALPSLMSTSAIENWGLIVYDDYILTLNPVNSSSHDRVKAGNAVAHGLAQQWFGNLVTMDWWSDIWLNEGFTEYFAQLAAYSCLPGLHYSEQFLVKETQHAIALDTSAITRPLSFGEGISLTDGKLYFFIEDMSKRKGSAVLRMLHEYMQQLTSPPFLAMNSLELREGGADIWLQGLHSYLSEHAHENADTRDLWTSLTLSTGFRLDKWMAQWSYKSGFPVIVVELSESGEFLVRQMPVGGGKCTTDSVWWIPIRFKTKANPTPRWAVLESCGPLKLDKQAAHDDFIIVNLDHVGLYMVSYSGPLFELVKDAIIHEGLFVKSSDVSGMLMESYSLAQTEQTDISNFLNLCLALGTRLDQNFTPWSILLHRLRTIRNRIEQEDKACSDKLNAFVRSALLNPMLNVLVTGKFPESASSPSTASSTILHAAKSRRGNTMLGHHARKEFSLSADSTDYDLGMLHELILLQAIYFRHEGAIQMAIALLTGGKLMRPDFRKAVYSAGVANGTTSVYHMVKAWFLECTDQQEKLRLNHALASATLPDRVSEALGFVLTAHVASKDVVEFIGNLAGMNELNAELAFEFAKQNLIALHEKIGSWEHVSEMFLLIVQNFGTQEKALAVEQYFSEMADHLVKTPYLDLGLETIENNIKWLARNKQPACNWLDYTVSR